MTLKNNQIFLNMLLDLFNFNIHTCKSYASPLKFNLIFSSWWWCPCATLTEFPLNFCDLGQSLNGTTLLWVVCGSVVRWCKKIICKNCESGTSTTTNNNQSHSMSRIFVVIFLTKDALCCCCVLLPTHFFYSCKSL